MKMKYIGILAALIAIAVSCKDNEKPSDAPSDTTTAVSLNYNYSFGTDDFKLNQYFTTATGEQVKFSLATFYLSKPELKDDAGNATPLSPEYIIVRPDLGATDFGEMEPSHAHEFLVSIGVDEATNTENGQSGTQPTDFSDSGHPLALQPEGMWWSWASGYIFVKLEGEVDYNNDGMADTTFVYHLGMNALRKDREVLLHSDMTAGEDFQVDMNIDLKEVFTNIDLQTELRTITMGSPEAMALAMRVMNNFNDGVTIELHDHESGHN